MAEIQKTITMPELQKLFRLLMAFSYGIMSSHSDIITKEEKEIYLAICRNAGYKLTDEEIKNLHII